eukprot:jgi/Psemu1/244750/estExt_Genewise1.C_4920042
MSNVYLANSMIHLACKAGGGFDPEGQYCLNSQVTVYGMKPAALISNIAVAASVLSSLFMPLFGAIIDYTSYRKLVGVGTAAALVIITGIQIATLENTWFAMAILQAIIFCVYQVQVMALFAYYPELATEVGEKRMNSFVSTWSFTQFLSQATVNLVILLLSASLKLGTVRTAMVSQGIVMTVSVVFITMCWSRMPQRSRKHVLPKGHSLTLAGFKQNFRTFKKIMTHYKRSLRWFLLSTIFGEAAASAVGSTAVVFLNGNIGLSALKIGIFFEVSLIGVVVGTKCGSWVTKKTNPNTSLILSELGLFFTVGCAVWAVQDVRYQELTYIWGFSIGFFLGWFYPAENVFFSMCVPKNQEAELSGFFGWSSQILGWVPPLVFSIMVQAGISLAWALTVMGSIFLISIFFLLLCPPWDEVVKEAQSVVMDFEPENDDSAEKEIE